VRLPPRLQATADLVPTDARSVADIGSGHGALAAALALRGMRVVATERTPGSFAALCADSMRLSEANRAAFETRMGDGFAALAPGEVEVAVIAGLGGRSIIKVLERAPWLPHRVVLQPMQDAHLVGEWLRSRGWPAHESRIVQGRRWYLGWLVEVPAAARTQAA
jgi:tRNA (adenine22-N1)-methyltransferase